MTAAGQIAALAAGDPAASRIVLQNCRTAAFGTVAYGREETTALFRAAPLVLDAARAVAGGGLIALAGHDREGRDAALFADVHDAFVLRLWVLSATRLPSLPVEETAVAADLVRDQRGARFDFAHEDFAALDDRAAERLRVMGQEWIDAQPATLFGPLERAVPVLLRAASAGGRTAALLMVQGFVGTEGIACCAVGVRLDDGEHVVVDAAGRAAGVERGRSFDLRAAHGGDA